MTVKRRIFLTNSMMVLLSLTVLLLIVGKGRFCYLKRNFWLGYRDNSKISDQYAQVYMEMPALIENTDTFEQLAENLGEYDYRLIVVNQKGKTVYQNARHSEEESAETLYTQEKTPGELVGYFVENTSILSYRDTRQDQYYDFYAVSCPSGVSIMGMDRGMFEMFLLVLLAVGVAAIAVILLLSQILTKWLTAQILKPVKELDLAARRVIDGDLSTQICYNTEDEFKNTCDSFDLCSSIPNRKWKKIMRMNWRAQKWSAESHMIFGHRLLR